MKTCSVKLEGGEVCPTPATRLLTLSARGLVFAVPICDLHFRMLPAKPPGGAESDPAGWLKDVLERGRQKREGR